MAAPKPLTMAEQLRAVASDILAIADEYEVQSMTMGRVERLIGHVEQAADDVRAIARGRR